MVLKHESLEGWFDVSLGSRTFYSKDFVGVEIAGGSN